MDTDSPIMQTKRSIGVERCIALVLGPPTTRVTADRFGGGGYEYRCEECTCGPDCECGGDCGGNCTC